MIGVRLHRRLVLYGQPLRARIAAFIIVLTATEVFCINGIAKTFSQIVLDIIPHSTGVRQQNTWSGIFSGVPLVVYTHRKQTQGLLPIGIIVQCIDHCFWCPNEHCGHQRVAMVGRNWSRLVALVSACNIDYHIPNPLRGFRYMNYFRIYYVFIVFTL